MEEFVGWRRESEVCNWVVLGDSLSEGVGFERHSWVSALVARLRQTRDRSLGNSRGPDINLVRFRSVSRADQDRFVKFGYAADVEEDSHSSKGQIWIWNLACEGTTLDSDLDRIRFVATLRPSLVFVFRGSLDSIVRPAPVRTGVWPWWIPATWRGYAAMDPRCYYSSVWWRRVKQRALDALKQRARKALLRQQSGFPLRSQVDLERAAEELLVQLRPVADRVAVCGMLPVDDANFPGSAAAFERVHELLRDVAERTGVEFIDWGAEFSRNGVRRPIENLFYRDGFHPNREGCEVLASAIESWLFRAARQE